MSEERARKYCTNNDSCPAGNCLKECSREKRKEITPRTQSSTWGYICPWHGLYYGICHCCLKEREKQAERDYIESLQKENEELREENRVFMGSVYGAMKTRAEKAESNLAVAVDVVNEQAEDDGLWFIAEYVSEQYLQDALRRLHRAVEGQALTRIKESYDGWVSEREKKMIAAIEWACGITEDGFEKPENTRGQFWWRKELRRRAGLEYYTYDNTDKTILIHQGTQPPIGEG